MTVTSPPSSPSDDSRVVTPVDARAEFAAAVGEEDGDSSEEGSAMEDDGDTTADQTQPPAIETTYCENVEVLDPVRTALSFWIPVRPKSCCAACCWGGGVGRGRSGDGSRWREEFEGLMGTSPLLELPVPKWSPDVWIKMCS